MAVIRQENWLGNQRVDIPHLRSVESGVAGDFDLLAGAMMSGRSPTIVSGFYVITTGITLATNLKIRVGDSSLIHFLASESGSIFHVPASRPDEQLSSTNPRVIGSFTPDQVNYIGLDFIRQADDSTTDLVEFLDSVSKLETPVDVPLGRTLDYRIHISTLDFDNNPGIAPICKVTTGSANDIVLIEDAREQMFRLGQGGTLPDIRHSFPWPAGRKENVAGDVFVGGDKAIGSFKAWMDAVMSRLWDVGGGEDWYSPTNYANERLARTGSPFVSNGEFFEWDGTNLHWKGLVWIFANSTAVTNAVQDQTTNLPGVTDLAEGDCVYVDVNRFSSVTVIAAKAALATLGSPDVPGSRYVIAWRHNNQIWTRDQSYFVGAAFKNATVVAAGMVTLSATDSAPVSPAAVATVDSQTFSARAAGLSRGYFSGPATPSVSDFIGGPGDITIGGGNDGADGFGGGNPVDFNVLIRTSRSQDEVNIRGGGNWLLHAVGALRVENADTGGPYDNVVARFAGRGFTGPSVDDHVHIFSDGSIGFDTITSAASAIPTPAPIVGANIRTKFFVNDNGLVSPNTRDQLCVMWFDGSITILATGPAY